MFRYTGLAIIEHRLGHLAVAERQFAALRSEMGDAALYQQAQVVAQWGRGDDALAALERALILRDSGLTSLAVDPLLDPIRSSPRFANLIRALNAS